jgi:hypothetical protein
MISVPPGRAAERDYLEMRLRQERAAEAAAADPGAALTHRRLAQAYAERLAALPDSK